tara:strand:+ start:258 stop:407 length:150 start_codon:yes stop_codon:yes gene_type:complete
MSQQRLASGLAPLIRVARILKPHTGGVIDGIAYRLNTSVLQGIDNGNPR